MRSGILVGVLLYEVIFIVGIGWWLARRQAGERREGEFALAGRSLPMPVVAVTLALTVLGTAHILGVFEMSWYVGAAAVWFSIAHVILLVVVCLATGLWVRRLRLTTLPEILETLFGPATRLMVGCVMAGVLFGILTVETQGVGIIMAAMTGWSIRQGAIAGGLLGMAYVIFAGMKEVGWLNLCNAIVMYLGLVLAVIYLALRLPGGDFDSVRAVYQSEPFMLSIYGNAQIMRTFVLATVIAVVFSQAVNQMLMQPCMSAADERTIRRALWIAAPLNGVFGVFAVVIGLTAKALPEFQALGPKTAATAMLVAMLPPWLAALLLASFLAAILSTFAMVALAPATIFAMDIYKRLYRPAATEAELTRLVRIGIVVFSALAMAVAASLPPILAAMNWLFSWLIPVFWVLVIGLLWKRSSSVAVATLIAAWLVNCLWSFTGLPRWLGMPADWNVQATLAVTLVVALGGSLAVRGEPGYFRSPEYRSRVAVAG